jgi:hypothetical protein
MSIIAGAKSESGVQLEQVALEISMLGELVVGESRLKICKLTEKEMRCEKGNKLSCYRICAIHERGDLRSAFVFK